MGRSEPNDRAVLSAALSAGETISGGALGSLLASFIIEAAAYLRKRASVSPAELLERLAGVDLGGKGHPFDDIDPSEATAGYRLSVARSLALHLPEFRDTPATDILAVGAFCHPDNIPVDVLADALDCPQPEVEGWLSALADVSIVNYADTVSVHRLMQQVVRVEIGKDRSREGLTKLVGALAGRFADPLDYRNWPMQDRYAAHAERAVAYAESLADVPEAGRLGNHLGVYLWNRARLEAALGALRAAERIDRKACGDDHPNVGTVVNNIGLVLQDRGDLAGALKRYEEAERIDRKAYGDHNPRLASHVNSIASVLYARGDMEGAREKALEAFDIRIRTLGPRSLDTLLNARNLVAVGVDPIAEARRIAGDKVAQKLRRALAEEGEKPDAESSPT